MSEAESPTENARMRECENEKRRTASHTRPISIRATAWRLPTHPQFGDLPSKHPNELVFFAHLVLDFFDTRFFILRTKTAFVEIKSFVTLRDLRGGGGGGGGKWRCRVNEKAWVECGGEGKIERGAKILLTMRRGDVRRRRPFSAPHRAVGK